MKQLIIISLIALFGCSAQKRLGQISSMAIICVGDSVTGLQEGTISYESVSGGTVLDSNGCFDDADMGCGENVFKVLAINEECDPPCRDSVLVYMFKCCINTAPICKQ